LTVRTPATLEMNETFSEGGRSTFKNHDGFSVDYQGQTKYKVVTPMVLSGGVSFQISDFLVVGGDAEFTDWTTMKFESDNAQLLDENRRILKVLRPTTNLKGGLEVILWDLGLHFRGGVGYYPSPYLNDPKEYDQLVYTGGIGFEMEDNTVLNASYALARWSSYRDNYTTGTFTSRTAEKISSGTLNITLSYRF
jgi:long-subunit fatty acid transport protein